MISCAVVGLGKNCGGQKNSSLFVAINSGVVAGLLLLILLNFAAGTPRARLNVIQIVSTLFFLAVILRHIIGGKSAEGESHPKAPNSRRGLIVALVLGAAVYLSIAHLYFVADDFAHLWHARQPLLQNVWDQLIRGQDRTFLRPLGFASIFWDYRLWNGWPPGYHLTNMLLHLAVVSGVFFLCEKLGLNSETCTTAAAIFAVLPSQAEAVAWISARFDLLATVLMIWSIVLYVSFRLTGRTTFYIGALLCFVFAIFSKESAYVLPFLLISLELLVLSTRKLKPALGFLLFAAVAFIYRWHVLGGIGGYLRADGQPATLALSAQTPLGLFVRAPAQLLLGYNWLQPGGFWILLLVSATGGLLVALVLIAAPGPTSRRLMGCSMIWMVLATAPAHPLLLIDPGLTNSRVLYPASSALALLLALLLAGIKPLRMRRCCACLLVTFFTLGLLHNLNAWRWTCQLSRRFVSELRQLEPSPPPDTEFAFFGLPERIRGIFFLPVGFRDLAVKEAYGREDLYASRSADALSGSTQPAAPGRRLIKVYWKGTTDHLLASGKN